MLPFELYDLALKVRKAKPWMRLLENQYFCVGHEDGRMHICFVMGSGEQHLGFVMHPDVTTMLSYNLQAEDCFAGSRVEWLDLREAVVSQDALSVSFESEMELTSREKEEASAYCASRGTALRGKNAFPKFQRFQPLHVPWYVTDARDQRDLEDGMRALLYLCRHPSVRIPQCQGPWDEDVPLLIPDEDGFEVRRYPLPPFRRKTYPVAPVRDEFTRARLRSPKRGPDWLCHIFLMPNPTSDEIEQFADDAPPQSWEPEHAPVFHYALAMIDRESGLLWNLSLADEDGDYTQIFLQEVTDQIRRHGSPASIIVQNYRDKAFFKEIASAIGAKLSKRANIPLLEEIMDDLANHLMYSEEREEPQSPEETLLDLLNDEETVRTIPDEMLLHIKSQLDPEHTSRALLRQLNRILRARGLI